GPLPRFAAAHGQADLEYALARTLVIEASAPARLEAEVERREAAGKRPAGPDGEEILVKARAVAEGCLGERLAPEARAEGMRAENRDAAPAASRLDAEAPRERIVHAARRRGGSAPGM